MAGPRAAQTAFGPMIQVAVEQYEAPERRIVDDDLAAAVLPRRQRVFVGALRWMPLRRLAIAAAEKAVPGAWTIIACRKRFIDDRLNAALGDIDAVVDLGAGLDTRGCRLARRCDVPTFEVDVAVNVDRKRNAITRAIGAVPASVRLVPVDFERDDLVDTLMRHGHRPDARTFFIWEGVTQYLTEDAVRATLAAIRVSAPGSRLTFTYVRRGFIEGRDRYRAEALYRRFRVSRKLWLTGFEPDEIAPLLAEYGWRVVEQAGADYHAAAYLRPAGRDLTTSDLEWTVYAELNH